MAKAVVLCLPVVLLLIIGILAQAPAAAIAADEDPLQDFCVALSASEQQELLLQGGSQQLITSNGLPCKPAANVRSSDFASQQLRQAAPFTGDLGSAVNLAIATTFGALNTQGLSIARIDFKPKGVSPPHVHPRASEVLFVAQGTLMAGFISTSNKYFHKTLHTGDIFVFPRGLVHFLFNPHSAQPALAIAALNSQNPGASLVAAAMFAADPPLPEDVLETTLGVGDTELHHLIASVQNTLK